MMQRSPISQEEPMRDVTLAMAVAIICAAGLVDARQSRPPDVGLGRIAWFDLTTTNVARSKDFYGKLFGWTFNPVKGTDQAVEIMAGGTAIGTLRSADGAISGFNGVVYVQVADVQSSSKKATELGAQVVTGFPFNLPGDTGAISLILDPSGHPLGMYSKALIPAKPPAR
jgi:predicted enzyme related to lactoylglutathione lyase